jgi:hypothetical protein
MNNYSSEHLSNFVNKLDLGSHNDYKLEIIDKLVDLEYSVEFLFSMNTNDVNRLESDLSVTNLKTSTIFKLTRSIEYLKLSDQEIYTDNQRLVDCLIMKLDMDAHNKHKRIICDITKKYEYNIDELEDINDEIEDRLTNDLEKEGIGIAPIYKMVHELSKINQPRKEQLHCNTFIF